MDLGLWDASHSVSPSAVLLQLSALILTMSCSCSFCVETGRRTGATIKYYFCPRQVIASGWAPALIERTQDASMWILLKPGMICMSGNASSGCWPGKSAIAGRWQRNGSALPRLPPLSTIQITSASLLPRSSEVVMMAAMKSVENRQAVVRLMARLRTND